MRSSRVELTRAKSKVSGARRKLPLTRQGVAQPTPLQLRMQDQNNFRDLSQSVRHLTYHMWPVLAAEESWKWNLDQLAKRWGLFNGKKVLGINCGDDTATVTTVITESLNRGMRWDCVIERPNNPGLGEVMTWLPCLVALDPEYAGPNEVVFSAHAKGVKYGGCPPLIRDWTQSMYDVNLDDWQSVQEHLEWFVSTGAYRSRYSRGRGCKNGLYYSGAFWWWRLGDIGQRNWCEVAQHYAGRELWIGNVVSWEEAGCLFIDRPKSLYDPKLWAKRILPALVKRGG